MLSVADQLAYLFVVARMNEVRSGVDAKRIAASFPDFADVPFGLRQKELVRKRFNRR
jgi:hypothetical protein